MDNLYLMHLIQTEYVSVCSLGYYDNQSSSVIVALKVINRAFTTCNNNIDIQVMTYEQALMTDNTQHVCGFIIIFAVRGFMQMTSNNSPCALCVYQ
jgi:hypothetical protein